MKQPNATRTLFKREKAINKPTNFGATGRKTDSRKYQSKVQTCLDTQKSDANHKKQWGKKMWINDENLVKFNSILIEMAIVAAIGGGLGAILGALTGSALYPTIFTLVGALVGLFIGILRINNKNGKNPPHTKSADSQSQAAN